MDFVRVIVKESKYLKKLTEFMGLLFIRTMLYLYKEKRNIAAKTKLTYIHNLNMKRYSSLDMPLAYITYVGCMYITCITTYNKCLKNN